MNDVLTYIGFVVRTQTTLEEVKIAFKLATLFNEQEQKYIIKWLQTNANL